MVRTGTGDAAREAVEPRSAAASTAQAPRLLRLLKAAGEVGARLEASLTALGLSLGKFGLLGKLAEAKDPLSLSQLADDCGCVRSNVTQLVDRLEADGLVTRLDNPTDRRSIRAALTPLGRERFRQAARAVERTEKELVAGWQEADRAALTRVVSLLDRCTQDDAGSA